MKKDKVKEIDDVVLQFQHKDCVLVGGQTKEDSKEDNVFLHEIYDGDKINQLLVPKVFTNAKRYTKDGIEQNITYKPTDNLIIKGNNLIAIASLLPKFENKIKLIYIDPPYNTGSTGFSYNDSFERSTWLTFMKNRLEIAKKLLSDDGSLFISIDENMKPYLWILCEEIGFEFFKELIWESGKPFGFKATKTKWPRMHETILHFCKNRDNLQYFPTYTEKFSSKGNPILTGSIFKVDSDKIYSMDFIAGAKESVGFGSGQKPESLIKKLLLATTKENDIVLDFFLGSGTTAAVAHKMKRQYIGVEQMDYIDNITLERLKNVINGDSKGISKSVNWQGGGSFVYCELKENNDKYINFSDIDKEECNVSESDKNFTKSFYNSERS